jgi:hypothetical protein
MRIIYIRFIFFDHVMRSAAAPGRRSLPDAVSSVIASMLYMVDDVNHK